ncbi:MAG TPA: hypothetical protein H9830_07805 [Candidatus Agrococcus pullicola]|uniref:LPXTG cell wall anchor domain-containing protein n=1 Tax=Candidatus Agrococcus pullicola TaxID=2838429 RepID=A0A9D1YUP8_9MICO|nr:hypothetical protein [Candidatus Agrococcus pullicola]
MSDDVNLLHVSILTQRDRAQWAWCNGEGRLRATGGDVVPALVGTGLALLVAGGIVIASRRIRSHGAG